MRFFRFISLSKIFVACILIISTIPSSAQHAVEDNFTLSRSGLFFRLWDALKTHELCLFLNEAKEQNVPAFQIPEEKIGKIFKTHTTAPVKDSYLGYYKLHNTSMDSWRKAITWGKCILYVHDDNKVTGWFVDLDGGAGKATYETRAASDDLTNAFLGKVNDDGSITFSKVTIEGKSTDEGYETCEKLEWKGDHVLMGKWKGGSVKLNPRHQHQNGNVCINMYSHNYCEFDVKDAIKEFENTEKWNEGYILGRETKELLNIDDIKLIIAWYTVKAWEAYESYLPEDLKSKKNDILDFRVGLMPQVYSFDKSDDNEKKLPVPMQFGKSRISEKYNLFISTKDFFSNELENEKTYSSKLSLIAHEILGHGIFFRLYSTFISKETAELDNYAKFKKYIYNIFMDFEILEILGFEHDELKYENLKSEVISEGLAVAVEYAVYKSGHKNSPSKIEDFTEIRYSSDNGERYRDGVTYLKKKGIITEKGELDFEKLNASNQ